MPHVQSFSYGLKMTWINKLLDPLHISPWKTLFMDKYNKYGADKILMMDQKGIEKVSSHFNKFWQDIFQNWGRLRQYSTENYSDILSQSIWFNDMLKIDQNTVFYNKWCEAGVYFINDLLDENNEFLTFDRFKEKFGVETNFLKFMGILHMIPNLWKEKIKDAEKITDITCEIFEYVKNNKKSSRYFYRKFVSAYSEEPIKQQKKWEKDLDMEIEQWDIIYKLPFLCTRNHKFIIFQFKILH